MINNELDKVNTYGIIFKVEGVFYSVEYNGNGKFSNGGAIEDPKNEFESMTDRDMLVCKIVPDDNGIFTTIISSMRIGSFDEDDSITMIEALQIPPIRKILCEKIEEK